MHVKVSGNKLVSKLGRAETFSQVLSSPLLHGSSPCGNYKLSSLLGVPFLGQGLLLRDSQVSCRLP